MPVVECVALTAMATRRALNSVLTNFLGTFVSRYSSYDGFWLFGFLVSTPQPLRFDLLHGAEKLGITPVAVGANLAVMKFREQLNYHGLDASQVQSGEVVIERLDGQIEGQVDSRPCIGHHVRVAGRVVSDQGKVYCAQRIMFVAPHNPEVERRNACSG